MGDDLLFGELAVTRAGLIGEMISLLKPITQIFRDCDPRGINHSAVINRGQQPGQLALRVPLRAPNRDIAGAPTRILVAFAAFKFQPPGPFAPPGDVALPGH
jgi:hypothetical protein